MTLPGAHPTALVRQMGLEIPTFESDGDATAFVRAQVEEGSDVIKIFQDDAPGMDGKPRFPKYDSETLGRIIAAAHGEGRQAIVHVSQEKDAATAFAQGADALAHVFADRAPSAGTVAAARKRNAAVITTLSVIARASGDRSLDTLIAYPEIARLLSPIQRGMAAQTFRRSNARLLPQALENVRVLVAGGVTILAGTDAPNPGSLHGAGMHQELALLVRAGLAPRQALAAATSRPAAFFGMEDRGRIAVGRRADLILVDGNPLKDIRHSVRITHIWKNGFGVDRTKLPPPPQALPAASGAGVTGQSQQRPRGPESPGK